VRPYADGGEHALPNGRLLRADIHRLVRRRLRHGHARPPLPREPRPRRRLPHRREYERFAGRVITVPRTLTDQPNPELLDWHAAEVFRG